MNGYALMVLEHLKECLPRRFARLSNPEAYCEMVGEEVEAAIMTAREDIRASVPPGLSQDDRRAWITAAWNLAKQRIVAEKIYLPPEPSPWEDPEPQRPDEMRPFQSLGTSQFHLLGSSEEPQDLDE